jgi:putative spermidine/putrescine transport system ATP-binding protein/putrescine transport system ATP-binding protein
MSGLLRVASITKRFGDALAVDQLSFFAQRGQTLSLLGPSGCGKTTTLRLIAGFEIPDRGTIHIAGQSMMGRRPYERNVGLLFQDYALFPHMTVEQNISYGLWRRGFDRATVRRRTAEMLELVSLVGMERRRPQQLSGGQQQRVALARALAPSPEVILLDEPLSALDAKLRQELRIQIKEILTAVGATAIVVTHDQEEAMSLGDQVIVMAHGRIMQQGSPTEIYLRPVNRFVAEFIGQSNWFSGQLGQAIDDKTVEFAVDGGLRFAVPRPSDLSGQLLAVCVRPERLVVQRDPVPHHETANINSLNGRVVDSVHLGPDVRMIVQVDERHKVVVIEKNLGHPIAKAGESIVLRFSAKDCILVPDGSKLTP